MADLHKCACNRPRGGLPTRIYCGPGDFLAAASDPDFSALWQARDSIDAEPFITGIFRDVDKEDKSTGFVETSIQPVSPPHRQSTCKRLSTGASSDKKRRKLSTEKVESRVKNSSAADFESQQSNGHNDEDNDRVLALRTRECLKISPAHDDDHVDCSQPLTESSPVRSFAAAVVDVLGGDADVNDLNTARKVSVETDDTLLASPLLQCAPAPETPIAPLTIHQNDPWTPLAQEHSINSSIFKAPFSVQKSCKTKKSQPNVEHLSQVIQCDVVDGTPHIARVAASFSIGEWSPSFETQAGSTLPYEQPSQFFSADDQSLITPIRSVFHDTPLATHNTTDVIRPAIIDDVEDVGEIRRLDWSLAHEQHGILPPIDGENHVAENTISRKVFREITTPAPFLFDTTAIKPREPCPHSAPLEHSLEHTPMLVPPTPTADQHTDRPLVTPMVTRNRVDTDVSVSQKDMPVFALTTPVISSLDISKSEAGVLASSIDKTQLLTNAVLMEYVEEDASAIQQSAETPNLLAHYPVCMLEAADVGCTVGITPDTTDLLRHSQSVAINVSSQSSSGGPLAKALFREKIAHNAIENAMRRNAAENQASISGQPSSLRHDAREEGHILEQTCAVETSSTTVEHMSAMIKPSHALRDSPTVRSDALNSDSITNKQAHQIVTNYQGADEIAVSPELIENTFESQQSSMPLRNDGSLNTQALADEASAMFEDLNNTAASALFEDIYPSIQRITTEEVAAGESDGSFAHEELPSQMLTDFTDLTPWAAAIDKDSLEDIPLDDSRNGSVYEKDVDMAQDGPPSALHNTDDKLQPKDLRPASVVSTLSIVYNSSPTQTELPMTSVLSVAATPAESTSTTAVEFSVVPANHETVSSTSSVVLFDTSSYDQKISARQETTTKPPSFSVALPSMGFQTASGKKVDISAEALANAQRLFNEPDYSANIQEVMPTTYPIVGFQTASSKKVDISDTAIAHAQKLFEDDISCPLSHSEIPPSETSTKDTTIAANVIPSLSIPPFVGFQTAAGQKVNISTSSSAKADQLFADADSSLEKSSYATTEIPTAAGFPTASDAKVNISTESFAKAHALFADDMNEPMQVEHHSSLKTASLLSNAGAQTMTGFQTASGAKGDISAESLSKAQALFADDMIDPNYSTTSHIPATVGFQTACGAKVNISVESLSKARALFADELDNSEFADHSAASNIPATVGFQTASGAKVNISADSLSKAQALFADDMVDSEFSDHTATSPVLPTFGFQTANGTKVDVSDASIAQARAFFASDTTEDPDNQIRLTTSELIKAHPAVDIPSRPPTSKQPTPPNIQPIAQWTLSENKSDQSAPTAKFGVQPSAKVGNGKDYGRVQQQRQPKSALPKTRPFKPLVPKLTPSGTVPTPSTTPLTSEPSTLSLVATVPRPSPMPGFVRGPASVMTDRILSTKANTPAPFLSTPAAAPGAGPINTPAATPLIYRLKGRKPGAYSAQAPDVPFFRTPKPVAPRIQSAPNTMDTSKTKPAVNALLQTSHAGALVPSSSVNRDTEKRVFSLSPPKIPRLSLRELAKRNNMTAPCRTPAATISVGVPQRTCAVTCQNAGDFRFTREYLNANAIERRVVECLGGTLLHVAHDMTIGHAEFEAALKATPDIDPKLLHPRWVANHYKWIVYKLAAQDCAFASNAAALTLTPLNVMNQLKYRYEREFNRCERSAIRKMLEGDDNASRFMVLFVSRIEQLEGQLSIDLSDGWYSVRSQFDGPLSEKTRTGKINVGTKLCIFGAELCGCPQPMTPLELDSHSPVHLKISANSTRRARWDTKLGYQRQRVFPVRLESLFPDGGLVSCTDVVITRAYPLFYIVKHSNGTREFRSERAYDALKRKVEDMRQEKLDYMLHQSENDGGRLDSHNTKSARSVIKRLSTTNDVLALGTDGAALFDAVQRDAEQATFVMAQLSSAQKAALEQFTQERKEQHQQQFVNAFSERDTAMVNEYDSAIPLFRVKVVDYRDFGGLVPHTITLYRPTDDTKDMMKEGQRLIIFGLRARHSTQQYGGPRTQLNTGRATRFHLMPAKENILKHIYSPRVCASFVSLRQYNSHEEVDLVGWVVAIGNEYLVEHFDRTSVSQKVFLSNEHAEILVIEFRGGLKASGVESVVRSNTALALFNLVYDCYDAKYQVSVCHTTEQTCVSSAPRAGHLKAPHAQLSSLLDHRPALTSLRGARTHVDVKHSTSDFDKLRSQARDSVSKIMSDTVSPTLTHVMSIKENTTSLEEVYATIHPGNNNSNVITLQTMQDGAVAVAFTSQSMEDTRCPIHGNDDSHVSVSNNVDHYVVSIDDGVCVKCIRVPPVQMLHMLRECLNESKAALFNSTYMRLVAFTNNGGMVGVSQRLQGLRNDVLSTWKQSTRSLEELLVRIIPHAAIVADNDGSHPPCRMCSSSTRDSLLFTRGEWRQFSADVLAILCHHPQFKFTLTQNGQDQPILQDIRVISNEHYLRHIISDFNTPHSS